MIKRNSNINALDIEVNSRSIINSDIYERSFECSSFDDSNGNRQKRFFFMFRQTIS